MMRIDDISCKPDMSGRLRLQLSDGIVLKLYPQTIADFGLYTGMELTQHEFQQLVSAAGQMSAKARAVRIVAATGVSKSDLEQRLIHKGETPEDAKNAVQWMESLDLINDQKTAEHLVNSCIQKGYGLARAKQVLYEKKIPKDLWNDVLADYPDQQDKILEFLENKLPQSPSDKDIRKTVDALLRRGHKYSQIKRALVQFDLDAEEFPEE